MSKAWLKLIFRTGGQSEAFLALFEMQRNIFSKGRWRPQVKFEAGPGMGFFGSQLCREDEFNDLLAVLCKPALVFPSFLMPLNPTQPWNQCFLIFIKHLSANQEVWNVLVSMSSMGDLTVFPRAHPKSFQLCGSFFTRKKTSAKVLCHCDPYRTPRPNVLGAYLYFSKDKVRRKVVLSAPQN